MPRTLTLILLILYLPLRAQETSQPNSISSTEIHAGVGAQTFLHTGIRYLPTNIFMVEVNLGIFPQFGRDWNSYYTYALGVSIVPNWNRYGEGNFLFTALYSVATNVDHSDYFYRMLTGNVGWMKQNGPGLSIMLRAGIGIANGNNYISNDQGGYVWKRDYLPWGNIEGTIGIAF